jgi:FHS family L-fucose permease-like MFS transporter
VETFSDKRKIFDFILGQFGHHVENSTCPDWHYLSFLKEKPPMQSKPSQLYSTIIVFFFWGFIAASNGIFIPFCKSHFQLNQFQSQLIDMTFYGGYFIGSLGLFAYGMISGKDLLNKIGLKKGIVYGLLLSALGALAIIPSVQAGSYAMILTAYFIIALGFSLQQTCAQPFVLALGPPQTGAHRLNLAGGINSLGTTIGPVAVSYVLFGALNSPASSASITSISGLYAGVAILFAAMALYFGFSALPALTNDAGIEKGSGALAYPHLVLGMLAIFIYVGVEVSIQSNMGALLALPEFGKLTDAAISPFISLYWGSLMIGRWTGSVTIFNFTGFSKLLAQVFVPLLAFAVVLGANALHGYQVSAMLVYLPAIAILILINLLWGDNPFKSLTAFALLGIAGMITGLFTSGAIATYAFVSGGLACSVLWPCIFSIAIAGLGKYTSQGSAFLIMMIVGGAVIPPIQGLMADMPSVGIHASYWVAVLCFMYLAWYGIKAKKLLDKQGISLESNPTSGH